MDTTIDPAAKYPHSWEKPPTKNRSPTGAVYMSSLSMKVAARMNSFHAVMKEKSAVMATAGLASGSTMRQKMVPADAPSMMAASSSSRGMVSKYPFSIQTLK